MSDLDDIYSARILELAAALPRTTRLGAPDGTAQAHSKLCGSTITVDIKLDGDRITNFGQTVKACLLGQASASVVGRDIVGASVAEVRSAAAAMRHMLKSGGDGPSGRFADLRVLAPVRDYKARHASVVLVFDALEQAFVAAGVSEQVSA